MSKEEVSASYIITLKLETPCGIVAESDDELREAIVNKTPFSQMTPEVKKKLLMVACCDLIHLDLSLQELLEICQIEDAQIVEGYPPC